MGAVIVKSPAALLGYFHRVQGDRNIFFDHGCQSLHVGER